MSEQAATKTVYLGGLTDRVNRAMLYELGVQAGPVVSISLPSMPDNQNKNRGYGFIEFETVESAAYAVSLYRGTLVLHGRPVRIDYSGGKNGA